ncbi:hypothetical protein ES703_95522 [subsurface metagenome]
MVFCLDSFGHDPGLVRVSEGAKKGRLGNNKIGWNIMLPNFLVIGAMKSGTTSLYHYIKAHPEIFMPSLKEPNFFIKRDIGTRDTEWYESLFSDGRYAKALGEASVNYTKYPHYSGVPQRIAATNKDMKLIYVLRNPFDRTYSHYLHNIYAGIENEPFRDAIVRRPLYIQASLYYMQIQEYLKHFSREQVLILILDDLKHNPTGTVKRVFEFLEVDEQFVPPNVGEVRHQTKQKRGNGANIFSRYGILFVDNPVTLLHDF